MESEQQLLPFKVESHYSLQKHNSFHLPASARHYIAVTQRDQLPAIARWLAGRTYLILGGGSNSLFNLPEGGCFDGVVLHNCLMGREVTRIESGALVTAAAGENWHQLIKWCLSQQIYGLENLALIPGSVGAAPVQNIGSYGAEFAQYCQSVELFNLKTGQFETRTAEQCGFGYRHSIFKEPQGRDYLITAVTLKLSERWQPNLSYGPLQKLDPNSVTPQQLFDEVVKTRMEKLPDPARIGNAGSFFKNPQIPTSQADALLATYPAMPLYPAEQPGDQKLAAGWLIDQCGLKGYRIGGAGVHQQQALVLVNHGNATASELIELAQYVRAQVWKKFGVMLEPEVRLIGKDGEMSLEPTV